MSQRKARKPADATQRRVPKRGGGLRFACLFVLLSTLAYVITNPGLLSGTRLFAPLYAGVEWFSSLIAEAAVAILNLGPDPVESQGTLIVGSHASAQVKRGCDALLVCGIYCSAVLAFPAPWSKRLKAVAFGFALLQLLNLARVVILFTLLGRVPEWLFVAAHEDALPLVFLFVAILMFGYWAKRVPPRATQPA